MEKHIQEAIDKMNTPPLGTLTHVGGFYLDAHTNRIFFYTDENKIVVELRGGGATEGFVKKWVGRHIDDIRQDTIRLYKYYIHSTRWIDSKEVKDLIDKRKKIGSEISHLTDWIKHHTGETIGVTPLPELKTRKIEAEFQYKKVSETLNKERHKDFCKNETDPVDEYFPTVYKVNE